MQQPHKSAKSFRIGHLRGKGQHDNGTLSTRPIGGMFTNALPQEEASETGKSNNLASFGFAMSWANGFREHGIHKQTVVHGEMIGKSPGCDTPLPKPIYGSLMIAIGPSMWFHWTLPIAVQKLIGDQTILIRVQQLRHEIHGQFSRRQFFQNKG